jgi:hypothetical protein
MFSNFDEEEFVKQMVEELVEEGLVVSEFTQAEAVSEFTQEEAVSAPEEAVSEFTQEEALAKVEPATLAKCTPEFSCAIM